MLRKITNDLAASYLDFTGKKSASVSVNDYLQFREVAVKEYLMGLHKEPENNNKQIPLETQNISQQIKKSESITNVISEENNITTTTKQNDSLLSLLQSIPG